MKRRVLLLVVAVLGAMSFGFAQDVFDPADVINNYPGSGTPAQPASGQIGKWYRTPRLDWNTSQYKAYIYNGMAFRLRYPNNYNKADQTKKYPVILFFHGGGEIAPITDNENQLYWGARDFEDSLNSGVFNAFMLFPQVTNVGWDYTYFERVNTVLDTLKKYNGIDEDRIISMGLSNGGFASLYYSISFPRNSAVAIGSSPALLATFTEAQKQYSTHIPMFLASGGLDNNPNPTDVKNFVDSFASKGGNIRWNLYPQLEHFTWQEQWNSGFLVDYWKKAHKANPLIFYQKNVFCPDSAFSVRIGITSGYPQYQWQKDQVDMPGATSNEIVVSTFGSYRVRFRRVAGGAWSEWSPNPAVISPRAAVATPNIVVTGLKSKVLPAPDGSTSVPLELPAGYPTYEWRRVSDNALVSTARTFNATAGVYKGLIAGCNRLYSNNFTVVNANASTKPDSAGLLTAVRTNSTRNTLNWSLARVTLSDPTAFEIYRSTVSGGTLTLMAILPAAARSYTDSIGINETTNFYYKVRAVNEVAAAALSNEALAKETVAPSTPTGITVVNTGKTFVTLDWANSTDNIGVTGYDVFVGGIKKYTTTESAITADSLLANTNYTFTVKARDLSGNLSSESASVSTTTATLANGLKYRYYQGSWSLLPNFNTLTHVKNGTSATPDLSARTAGVDVNYGFVWEGYLVVPTTGSYTFELGSDDGSAMYLDKFYSPSATPTIIADGAHGDVPGVTKTLILTAGLHPIALTYFQIAGGQAMNVYWTGPGFTRRLIPANAYVETVQEADVTPPTAPSSLVSTLTGKTTVDLKWNASIDNIAVTGYNIYRNDTLKYIVPGTSLAFTADSLKAGTSYTFKVKAFDAAGNLSLYSNALNVTTTALANGLTYKYYEGTWDSLPNFNLLTPVKTGTSPNIDISLRTAGRNDYFGFVWEGYITIPTSGTYTFELGSDDGSKFYWNTLYNPAATALVNNDFGHGDVPTVSKSITVAAGTYPVAITYYEAWGGEAMKLFWTGPGIARAQVPNSAFIETAPVVDVTAPSVPANMRVTYTGKNSVSLAWDNATDNVGVTGYEFYINNVLKTTTLGTSVTLDTLASNTLYKFKVKARDAAGNTSAFSTEVSATTTAGYSGLTYKYFEGNWDSLPNFNLLTPVKTGSTANIDISIRPTGVNDYFAFVWEGYITIPTSGTYTFELGSDDGSKFYWNSLYNPNAVALVNNDYGHGDVPTVAKSITVAAGTYPVSITYFEKWGGEAMKLFWTGPGISRALIPNSAFIEPAQVVDTTAPSVPANMRVTYTGKNSVSLAWNNATDNVGVTGYDFYINNVLKTTSLATSITIDTLTANTLYKFKVKARDAAGNLSAFSSEVSTTTTAGTSGLTYKYYEGTWDSLPNFNQLTPVQTGTSANIDLNVRPVGRDDYFAFLWEGKITIPTSGTYTFELASDDGSKLYIGAPYSPTAVPLINNDFGHGASPSVSKSITLAAGVYPIAISYFEIWGGQSMDLFWSGPGIARQNVPNSAFIETVTVADTTKPTTPAGFATTYTGRSFIDLTWNVSTDNVGVTGYDVYVNSSTTPVSTTTNSISISGLTANTSYTFKVQAKDAAGNLSAFSTIMANSTASGLRYKYYEGDWSTLPNFNTLTPVKKGTTANIDVSPRMLDDYYAFVWEGYINIPNTGNYTFELASDDGSKFYFNTLYDPTANALVNNDGAHGESPTVTGSRMITAGIYPVTITYFEKWGGEAMRLYWTGPGITRQLVPNAAFTENFTVAVNAITPGTALQGISGIASAETAATALKIKAYPNPFVDKMQVQFNNPSSGNHITAVVYDTYGRMIISKDFGSLAAGLNTLTINTGSETKPGIYMVRLNINGIPTGMWKMIKEKK